MTEEVYSTAVHRAFAGRDRRFELRLGEIRQLEQITGVGIGEVYRRVATLAFTIEDIRQTIKLGLVGGGASVHDAEAMVRAAVDGRPLNDAHEIANAVLLACFVGVDTSGKPRGLGTRDDRGTSAPSTRPVPPPVSTPVKSTRGRSRNSKP